MTDRIYSDGVSSTDLIIVLNELFPDTSYGSLSVNDQVEALEAYLGLNQAEISLGYPRCDQFSKLRQQFKYSETKGEQI